MVSLLYSLSLAASLLSSVVAHGILTDVKFSQKSYPASEVQRPVFGQDPLYGRTSPQLVCNNDGDATTSSQVEVNPGDELTFQWDWTPAHHPGVVHEMLAFCGDDKDACNGFDVNGDVWFTVAATGLLEPSTGYDGGNWAADQLQRQGNTWTIQIPTGLKSGAYVLRHEIIAMHLVGNPEFYPSCVHIVVGGSGTGLPSSSDLYSIPGYMSTPRATEALDFNIFAIYDSYVTPAPDPPAQFSSSPSSPSTPSTKTTGSPASTPSSKPSSKPTKPKSTKPKATPEPEDASTDPEIDECGSDDGEDDEEDGATTSYNPPASSVKSKYKSSASSSSDPDEVDSGSCGSEAQGSQDDEDDGTHDYSKRFVAGVNVVRGAVRRMNGRHGKRRLSEWH